MEWLFVSLFVGLSVGSFNDEAPQWSSTYSVKGVLTIPFAEIQEPFTAYYDAEVGKSRIDYYNGMDKTYQLPSEGGPYGTMLKIIPMTDEHVKNQINCFAVNGSQEAPVKIQSILPDLTGFSHIGEVEWKGQKCQKWQKKEAIGHKVNKYTMWMTLVKSNNNQQFMGVPVHYEMKGFNSLLGSHYDHYYLEYKGYDASKPDPRMFDDYKSTMTCHDWPGPGMEHVYTMNPAREFINNHMDHVDKTFEVFKNRHGKRYRNDNDMENRKDIYRQNMRFVHSKNRQGLTFKLATNHLADWTDSEMSVMRGRLHSTEYNGGAPFKYSKYELNSVPSTLDWRLYGAVTPVKDQSVCGSCWSFGTVGTLEGANFLSTGQLVRFSQQALVDCSWGFGNNGCDGGEDFRVYQFMLKHGGIPSEDSYGPYLGQDGYCHLDQTDMAFQIDHYVNVTSGDLNAVQVALAKHGPLSVGIDASHKSLSFYSSGIYYEPECDNSPDGLDHAVLAVGYGEINGQKYWLVKNSWSTYWGNDGYVLMSQKDNNCGVATAATFVVPKK